MPRLLAIGDIHGHHAALETLIKLVRMGPDDTVVTLGDYVNRGPDSRGVIECLMRLGQQTQLIPLLGNHEVMMMEARQSPENLENWLLCGGDATLKSYGTGSLAAVPEAHWAFLHSCQRCHEADEQFFVHANVDPSLRLQHQSDYDLFWRHLEGAPWHISGKTMICGHTPQSTGLPLHLGRAICIDTDVHRGGWLTCFEPSTGRYWQTNDVGKTNVDVLFPG